MGRLIPGTVVPTPPTNIYREAMRVSAKTLYRSGSMGCSWSFLFLFLFFCFPSHLLSSPFLSRSILLIVVPQIRGHKLLFSPLRFLPRIFIARRFQHFLPSSTLASNGAKQVGNVGHHVCVLFRSNT